jgi:hypothetical protein
MSKFGYLRQDQDSHWYLIPDFLIPRFDHVLRIIEDDCQTTSEEDDTIELFIEEFGDYRLSGGCYDLKIPMENK